MANTKLTLFRYMDEEYCERMVSDGEIRIKSSTEYRDGTGLTELQMDDEQHKDVDFVASAIRDVKVMSKDINIRHRLRRPKEREDGHLYELGASAALPYWMCCFSTDLRRDLFAERDFNCDAAVVVHDADELFRRMADASGPHLGRIPLAQPVSYSTTNVSRYGRGYEAISPFFTKPSSYRHQKEYRFVLYPNTTGQACCHLRLGSLRDVCEVVRKRDFETGKVDEASLDWGVFSDWASRELRSNERIVLVALYGKKIRDIVKGPDGSMKLGKRSQGNTATRVLLDHLLESGVPVDEIDLESFHKAEQIAKRKVYGPNGEEFSRYEVNGKF